MMARIAMSAGYCFLCAVLMFPGRISAGDHKNARPSQMPREQEAERKQRQDRGAREKAAAAAAFRPPSASPAECLADFVRATRAAGSMNSLLSYLPPGERQLLQEMQKRFDPKLAQQKRAEYRRQNRPESEIEHLTGSPYDVRLKHLKRIAEKITKINRITKVDGDKAFLEVAIRIDDVINGTPYTRSTATVGLVAHGDMWCFTSFKESGFATR